MKNDLFQYYKVAFVIHCTGKVVRKSQQDLANNIQHIEVRIFPQMSLTLQGYWQIAI